MANKTQKTSTKQAPRVVKGEEVKAAAAKVAAQKAVETKEPTRKQVVAEQHKLFKYLIGAGWKDASIGKELGALPQTVWTWRNREIPCPKLNELKGLLEKVAPAAAPKKARAPKKAAEKVQSGELRAPSEAAASPRRGQTEKAIDPRQYVLDLRDALTLVLRNIR